MTNLLNIESVTAGYFGRPVLSDVTLPIEAGSLVLLLGPNGHGKTTLLRCISGLLPLTQGTIRYGGEDISGCPVEQLVGLGLIHIPQGDLLFPDMTIEENLQMGAYLVRSKRVVEERLANVYELIPKLKVLRQQAANSLSGGERRMLAIGRGLMAEARLILVDEPSLGLAPIVIDQVYELLSDLKTRGMTILLVEENASRALDLADHIHLLDNGRITWRGKASQMLASQEMSEAYLGA